MKAIDRVKQVYNAKQSPQYQKTATTDHFKYKPYNLTARISPREVGMSNTISHFNKVEHKPSEPKSFDKAQSLYSKRGSPTNMSTSEHIYTKPQTLKPLQNTPLAKK